MQVAIERLAKKNIYSCTSPFLALNNGFRLWIFLLQIFHLFIQNGALKPFCRFLYCFEIFDRSFVNSVALSGDENENNAVHLIGRSILKKMVQPS